KTTKCSESSMPKGINIKTYESIINFLYENPNEKLTSEEIADKIGLSRVTVRRYLEKLYEENKVDKICEYGKIGRPTNYYMLLNS
ncbi:HTH domain-containing protein, partial [Clostridium sp.]